MRIDNANPNARVDTINHSETDMFLQSTLYESTMQVSIMGYLSGQNAPVTTKGEPSYGFDVPYEYRGALILLHQQREVRELL